MTTYYHGTTRNALQSILIEGLDPLRMQRDDEPQPFIFIDNRLAIARDFANGVILVIHLTPEIEAALVRDQGEYIRCPVLIPPSCIGGVLS